jgi:hypothetical protein
MLRIMLLCTVNYQHRKIQYEYNLATKLTLMSVPYGTSGQRLLKLREQMQHSQLLQRISDPLTIDA